MSSCVSTTGARHVSAARVVACIVFAIAIIGGTRSDGADPVPAPPTNLTGSDHPHDMGKAIDLQWDLSVDDTGQADSLVAGYRLRRRPASTAGASSASDTTVSADVPESAWTEIATLPPGTRETTDDSCARGETYVYQLRTLGKQGEVSAPAWSEPVAPIEQYFNSRRAWFGLLLALVCGVVVVFTELAKAGKKLYVREIAGLKAIEEAVGRATEMGRTCLFVPGTMDMNDIATVAGITILARVARIAAEYDAVIDVPTCKSLVMTAARETVQGAYFAAGRAEAFNPDRVYYVTDEQFGYVASVTGKMVREKPAACFYAGLFYAESLILAETGNSIGAIQIAGTSETSQLPFFVAACDFTLIGEELFAASAYLSGEPQQLGTLKGQDAGKLLAFALLLVGCGLETIVALAPQSPVAVAWLRFLKEVLLGKGVA